MSSATGKGITNIATNAIIPKGKSELIKFGPKTLKPIVAVFCISQTPYDCQNNDS